ncbi:rhodanese-like domain-containing protein [Candidatus Babeliales bacterium]|nr:rhodanese-like domain-containing protein [Candidatus Babeliales bacterium]
MNQRLFVILFLCNFWVKMGVCSKDQQESVELVSTISCEDLHQKMEMNEQGLYVINVLPKDICKDCQIPGTLNIPVDKLLKKVQNWPKNREIVIHCAGNPCPLGRHAYELLTVQGFQNVSLFDGGLRSWKRQNLPTYGRCRAGYLKG